ncbi:MAG: hypothetical protein ACREQF_09845 [Candidatus Binataceae bacterium]
MRKRAIALLVVSALGVSGCYRRLGYFTVISTKDLAATHASAGPRVTGEDCTQAIFVVPIGSLNPTVEGATADALRKVPGAYMLTDVKVTYEPLITFAYNRFCVRVEGSAVAQPFAARPPTGQTQ